MSVPFHLTTGLVYLPFSLVGLQMSGLTPVCPQIFFGFFVLQIAFSFVRIILLVAKQGGLVPPLCPPTRLSTPPPLVGSDLFTGDVHFSNVPHAKKIGLSTNHPPGP